MNQLCIEPSSLPESGDKSGASDPGCSIGQKVAEIVDDSLLHVGGWARPPNWSMDQWMSQIRQVAFEAALEAERDHDAHPCVDFGAFVWQRVIYKLRDYCSKERRFGRRTVTKSDGSSLEKLPSAEQLPDQAAMWRELSWFVRSMRRQQSSLILGLYWLGLSESQMAHELGVNRRTIHRWKAEILTELRHHFAIGRSTLPR